MTDKLLHEDDATVEPTSASAKKPYQKPALIKLGALRDVTLSVDQYGRKDNGRGRNDKTGRGGLAGLGMPPRDRAS